MAAFQLLVLCALARAQAGQTGQAEDAAPLAFKDYAGRFHDLVACQRSPNLAGCMGLASVLKRPAPEWLPGDFLDAWQHERRTGCAKAQMQTLRRVLRDWLQSLPTCTGWLEKWGVVNTSPVGESALGIGSRLVQLAECFGCRMPVEDNDDWQFVARRGDETPCPRGGSWYCLFEDPDNLELAWPEPAPSGCDKDVRSALPNDFKTRTFTGALPISASMWLVTRNSPEVRAWVAQATQQRNEGLSACAERPKISLHVRTEGGRCTADQVGQASCTRPADALATVQRLKDLYGSCAVLLATDNQATVDEMLALPGAEAFHWKWLQWNREQLRSSDTDCPQCKSQHVEFRGGLDWHVGFSMAADIELLSEGDIFVGGFDSMVGLSYYFAMHGRSGLLPPYTVPTRGKKMKHFMNWLKLAPTSRCQAGPVHFEKSARVEL